MERTNGRALGAGGLQVRASAPYEDDGRGGVDAPPSSRVRIAQRLEAPGRSPGRFLFELLAAIEDSRGTHSIAFMRNGSEVVGEVLTSAGQVRLVALSEGQVPLGERLQRRNPKVAFTVVRAVRKARAEGRPLGEVLLGLGRVEADEIRAALLEQIGEGLAAIARASSETLVELTRPLTSRLLDSRLSSFPVADIYWQAMAALAPAAEDVPGRCFQALTPLTRTAVLAARWSERDEWLPVAVAGMDPLSLHDVAQLGRGIAQMAQPAAPGAATLAARLHVLKANGESTVCVVSDRQVAMLGGLDELATARVLAEARRLLDAAR